MKKTKTFLASILVVALIISVVPIASAKHFYDVPATIGDAYLDAINYVSDNGIMDGTGVVEFSPNAAITRADFVLILYRVSGDKGNYSDAGVFTDVLPNSYYYNAVGWAVHNGITGGTSPTTFSPSQTTLRQEMITFLYRFAQKMGYSTKTDFDLTAAEDYSSLSSYARTPMSWAYDYGILMRGKITDKLWPTALEDRKDTALFVSRFIRNVFGVVYNKNTFTFQNASWNFMSGMDDNVYLISEKDWNTLMKVATDENSYTSVESSVRRKWSGSCFGMSVALVMDYLGKIDLNGNYCNNTNSIADIPSLRNIGNSKHKLTSDFNEPSIIFTEVESKINLYQISWAVPSINDWVRYTTRTAALQEMIEKLSYSGIGVFSYINEDQHWGHAVVAFGKPIKTSYGYKIALSDNRVPSDERWLEITTNTNNWTASVTGTGINEPVGICKFQDDFSCFKKLDVDGYDNTLQSTNILENYTMLEVVSTGDFTITNAEGENLALYHKNGSSVDGTMNIIGQNFIPYGENQPVVYLFLVDKSSEYTCKAVNGAELSAFYASTGNYRAGGNTVEENSLVNNEITALLN